MVYYTAGTFEWKVLQKSRETRLYDFVFIQNEHSIV